MLGSTPACPKLHFPEGKGVAGKVIGVGHAELASPFRADNRGGRSSSLSLEGGLLICGRGVRLGAILQD